MGSQDLLLPQSRIYEYTKQQSHVRSSSLFSDCQAFVQTTLSHLLPRQKRRFHFVQVRVSVRNDFAVNFF